MSDIIFRTVFDLSVIGFFLALLYWCDVAIVNRERTGEPSSDRSLSALQEAWYMLLFAVFVGMAGMSMDYALDPLRSYLIFSSLGVGMAWITSDWGSRHLRFLAAETEYFVFTRLCGGDFRG